MPAMQASPEKDRNIHHRSSKAEPICKVICLEKILDLYGGLKFLWKSILLL